MRNKASIMPISNLLLYNICDTWDCMYCTEHLAQTCDI